MTLRDAEAASIRAFLIENSDKIKGDVLDFGCGQQPYRDLIERAGGTYHGYDHPDYGGSVVAEHVHPGGEPPWGTIVCTQVIQYMSDPLAELRSFRGDEIVEGGWLLITGPTNWPVIEPDDKWRYTPAGIVALLSSAGFGEVQITDRHYITHGGERWLAGWGAAARG